VYDYNLDNKTLAILKEVINNKSLSVTAKLIYIYLLVWIKDEKFPSRSKISSDLQITDITLGKHLKQLIKQGYICSNQPKECGRFGVNIYTFPKIQIKDDLNCQN